MSNPQPLTTIYSQIVKNSPSHSQLSQNNSQHYQHQNPIRYKHIQNPNTEYLTILEPEYTINCTNGLDIARRLFYKDWNYPTRNTQKNQTFYEYILVETDSIKINPHTDPQNPTQITHTSVFIQKILTISDWTDPPLYPRKFTNSTFNPPEFTYFDYIDAWHYTFLFQNSTNTHSWFFCFDKSFNNSQLIPNWFVAWWLYFGAFEQILPPSILDAFKTFTKNWSHIKHCPTIIPFFIHCRLSWIMHWEFEWRNPPIELPALHRIFLCKWWNKYDLTKCTSQTVTNYFTNKMKESQQLTLAKSQIQTSIASSSTTAELQQQIATLTAALAAAQKSEKSTNSTKSYNSDTEYSEDIDTQSSINLADDDDNIFGNDGFCYEPSRKQSSSKKHSEQRSSGLNYDQKPRGGKAKSHGRKK